MTDELKDYNEILNAHEDAMQKAMGEIMSLAAQRKQLQKRITALRADLKRLKSMKAQAERHLAKMAVVVQPTETE